MVKSKQVGLDEGSGEPCVGYPVELRVGYLSSGTASGTHVLHSRKATAVSRRDGYAQCSCPPTMLEGELVKELKKVEEN